MTNKDFENIKICAYHESGHAILAYFVKWTVKSIKIEFKNGNLLCGVTNYDFGNDENFVHYIENFT
jgi:ATP-dependent Zn protease